MLSCAQGIGLAPVWFFWMLYQHIK